MTDKRTGVIGLYARTKSGHLVLVSQKWHGCSAFTERFYADLKRRRPGLVERIGTDAIIRKK